MDQADIYEKLNELFVADVMAKILPGAIHNLANPIGGIIGRIQLMQARISKNFGGIQALYPELYTEFSLDKIIRDVDILAGESETMLAIFRNFEGKILASSACGLEMIDICQMIESEIKFADFYLDFKHGVSKTMTFKEDAPAISGERAGYSLCMSALINSARQRMLNAPEKELAVTVDYDDTNIRIAFQDSGEEITHTCCKFAEDADGHPDLQKLPVAEHCLCYAFMLLRHYGFHTEVAARHGRNVISLCVPYKAP